MAFNFHKGSLLAVGAVAIGLLCQGCSGSSAPEETIDQARVEADKEKLMRQTPPPPGGARPGVPPRQLP